MRDLYENTELTVAPDAPMGEDTDADDEPLELNHLSVAQLRELARLPLATQPRSDSDQIVLGV